MSRLVGSAALVLILGGVTLVAQEPVLKGRVKAVDAEKGTITVTLPDGKDRVLHALPSTRFMDGSGKEVKDALKSNAFRAGDAVGFKASMEDGKDYLVGLRMMGARQTATPKIDVSRLKPLTELGDSDYQGHKGGLYPGGKNERPPAHERAGLTLAKLIEPLSSAGNPSKDGKIVLLSVGMSNTSQASQGFQRALKGATDLNPNFLFVNGAQGGMTAARIQDPNDNASGTKYWAVVDDMLKKAGVSRLQVQVIWIKQADAGPKQGFPAYAKTLQAELKRIVQIFPERFPSVRLVYLSSRTYGGYATTPLNPEPYAFESGLSVKWLIEEQISGERELNFDKAKGPVRAPWLSWGPYLWVNGSTKRADGFFYERDDFVKDGTHLSPSGMEKVGNSMLRFFSTDSTAKEWFLKSK